MFWVHVASIFVSVIIFLFSSVMAFLNLPQRVLQGELYEKSAVVSSVSVAKDYKTNVRGHRVHRYVEKKAIVKLEHDKREYYFLLDEDKNKLSHDELSFAKIGSLIKNQKITIVLRERSDKILAVKLGHEIVFDDVEKSISPFVLYITISFVSLLLSLRMVKCWL